MTAMMVQCDVLYWFCAKLYWNC